MFEFIDDILVPYELEYTLIDMLRAVGLIIQDLDSDVAKDHCFVIFGTSNTWHVRTWQEVVLLKVVWLTECDDL
jgi:hypothetical protein